MGLIWWLSDQRLSLGPEELLFPGSDKLIHVVEYFVLAWLWLWALGPHQRKAWVPALLLSVVWGGIDEWHQTWVPGRDGNAGDLAANVVGVSLAGFSASRRHPRRTP